MTRESTFSVAISKGPLFTITYNDAFSYLFISIFFFSIFQILKLWVEGSKLSARKKIFIAIMACTGLRFFWYYAHPDIIHTRFQFSFILLFAQYTYYLPLALLFTAGTELISNWFHLYQKEKLRKKLNKERYGLQQVKRTPAANRKRALQKLSTLSSICSKANVVVYLVLAVSIPWYYYMEFRFAPPEVILSFTCATLLFGISFYTFRLKANLTLAQGSDSWKLKRHTGLSLFLSLSLICYYFFILLLYVFGAFELELQFDESGIYLSSESLLVSIHTWCRFFELGHSILVLTLLASKSLSLRAPFPPTTKYITQDWLTNVLRENGTIKPTTSVISFSTESLRGGCHFKVSRVSLRYSEENTDDPHKTVVVKLLYWDKPIYERIFLYLKFVLTPDSLDKEVMYLKSYRIESHFYKHQVYKLKGIRIPQCYYNLEDCFNNRFGMVLEDISYLEDGQPEGFLLPEAKLIVEKIAKFHAFHWQHRSDKKSVRGWDIAGYWTGDKRLSTKKKIESAWEKVKVNFPNISEFQEMHGDLGSLLINKFAYIQREFKILTGPEYYTLCHGDYKISNMFVQAAQKKKKGVVNVIDWQWFGFGNGCIDVSYFLATSLDVSVLGNRDELLKLYYDTLVAEGIKGYAWETFMHHYRICYVDFVIYVIASKWANMTPLVVRQYQQKWKDGLHLRSIDHMKYIAAHAHEIVAGWTKAKK